jgi:hypothetical protein
MHTGAAVASADTGDISLAQRLIFSDPLSYFRELGVERGLALDNELALISFTMAAAGLTCHYLKRSL